MSETHIVCCVPRQISEQVKHGIINYNPNDGALEWNCNECGSEIWVGPKQQELLKARPMHVVCFDCVSKIQPDVPGLETHIINLNEPPSSVDK